MAWTDVRRGLMQGIPIGGEPVELVDKKAQFEGAKFLGLYRDADRVIFSWSILGKVNHRTAVVIDGKVHEIEAEIPEDPSPQWIQRIITRG